MEEQEGAQTLFTSLNKVPNWSWVLFTWQQWWRDAFAAIIGATWEPQPHVSTQREACWGLAFCLLVAWYSQTQATERTVAMQAVKTPACVCVSCLSVAMVRQWNRQCVYGLCFLSVGSVDDPRWPVRKCEIKKVSSNEKPRRANKQMSLWA